MNLDKIKEIACQHNIKPGKMKKAELVRTIQKSEGNEQCFNSGNASECEQQSCLWREDCD